MDLYLIHWPRPSDLNAEWRALDVETWKALEDLYKSKKVRAIGVSNFLPHHLNNLLERTSITPMVNQLEFHPGYMQKAAVDFCKQMGIQVEAWSPIGRARVLKEPLLMELAEKYQVSMEEDTLLAEANKWELSHGGLSGRTAQQFINYLLGKE